MKPSTTLTLAMLPTKEKVEFRQGDFFEIAPGILQCVCPPKLRPKLAMARMMPVKGTEYFRAVVQVLPLLARRADWDARRYGCSWFTVVRLALADFVKMIRPGPRAIAIDLESFFDHIEAVRDNPFFWDEQKIKRLHAVESLAVKADKETADDPDPDDGDKPLFGQDGDLGL